jgi:hypothetical protein
VVHRVEIYGVTTTKNAVVHHVNKVIENIQWQPRSLGWIRLNTDRASKEDDTSR